MPVAKVDSFLFPVPNGYQQKGNQLITEVRAGLECNELHFFTELYLNAFECTEIYCNLLHCLFRYVKVSDHDSKIEPK